MTTRRIHHRRELLSRCAHGFGWLALGALHARARGGHAARTLRRARAT